MKNFNFDYDKACATHGVEIADAARRFYTLFTGGMVEWIGSIWDRKSGGFYFSHSARDTDGFEPDIESTGQALGVLQDLGLTEDPWIYPEPFRTRVVEYLRELQDPDGFFYHKGPLRPGETLHILKSAQVTASSSRPGYAIHVEIIAEGVQGDPVVVNDKTIYPVEQAWPAVKVVNGQLTPVESNSTGGNTTDDNTTDDNTTDEGDPSDESNTTNEDDTNATP